MYPPSLSYDQIAARQRKNLLRVLLGLIGISVLLLTAWIYFKEADPGTPLLNNVVVFSLVNLNIILLMVLILLVARNLVRLYATSRAGAGRGRLQVKLIVSFMGFTLVPSAALFLVASGLMDKSFNTFFNPKVERALKGAFEVAQTYYREAERSALFDAGRLARLAEERGWSSPAEAKAFGRFLAEERKSMGVDAIRIFRTDRSEVLAVRRTDLGETPLFSPMSSVVDKVLEGEPRSSVENWGDGDAVHGIYPLKSGGKVAGFVVVSKFISERLVEKVKGIFNAYEDYKELELSRNPIKASYIITFLLVALLILFAAIWFGFYIARGITVPIEKLAEATRAVSGGHLEHRVDVKAEGEVGILVDAFNGMTGELLANKQKIEDSAEHLRRSNLEIDRRRRYMEAMLENVRTGVVSINRRGRVTILNTAAAEMLHIANPQEAVGRPFNEVFDSQHLDPIRSLLRSIREGERESASEQVDLMIDGQVLTLRASLTLLRSAEGGRLGAVVIFDDMTALIRAQKVAAWREVAQGIAHEIKNPLTPIQLSAERMRHKFDQEALDFPEVFEVCTDTIIHQVQGLMKMVNEFSRFARMPEPRLRPCHLEIMLEEVVNLYRSRHGGVSVVSDIAPGLPAVMADAEQLERVFINLMENAFESMEGEGEISVRAYAQPRRSQLIVEVADRGKGIPEGTKDYIFSPYFSTKERGSGLGLAICHRIVADHNGSISVADNKPRGAIFRVMLPLAPASAVIAETKRAATIG